MMPVTYILPVICCLLGLSIAQYIRLHALTLGLVDMPSARSSHSKPTPRGGGLGIVVAMQVASVTLWALGAIQLRTWLLVGVCGSAIGVLGFIDDRHTLRASTRFAVHVTVAALAAWLACQMRADVGLASGIGMGVLFVLVLVWGINSFNFMDGIDGIAAMQALYMAAAAAFLNAHLGGPGMATALLVCLSAAVLGFLFLNWPPAKIFMGDGASGFLGFTLSLFAVAPLEAPSLSLPAWILLGGLFVCDAGITLLRRIFRGEPFLKPHRLHAYQHLARRWRSHLAVTATYSIVNLTWLLPWTYYEVTHPQSAWWVLPAALAPLALLLLVLGAGRQEIRAPS